MRRPVGLTLFALRYVVGGAIGFLAGITMVWFAYSEVKFAIELILISLLWFVLGIGLWDMRNWGRWASIVLALGSVLSQAVFALFLPSLFSYSWRHIRLDPLENVIDTGMVVYLFIPRVRRLFLPPAEQAGEACLRN